MIHIIAVCAMYLRTDRNVHLLLQDIKTESVHCTSRSISSMMASFFRIGASSRRTSISLGGAPSSIQVKRNNKFSHYDVIAHIMYVEYAFLGNRKFHRLSQ